MNGQQVINGLIGVTCDQAFHLGLRCNEAWDLKPATSDLCAAQSPFIQSQRVRMLT
jgi:hypothetical protein